MDKHNEDKLVAMVIVRTRFGSVAVYEDGCIQIELIHSDRNPTIMKLKRDHSIEIAKAILSITSDMP